jgi:plastocyanin
MRRLWVVLSLFALLFGASACSQDTRNDVQDAAGDVANDAEEAAEDAGEAAGDAADRAEDMINDKTVNIDDFEYEPASLTVKTGTEVTWVNQDDVPHTVTADEDGFESENLDEGDEFSNRFTDEGTFKYHCEVHGADRMSGTVTVES